MRTHRPRRRESAGFTLIELLILLVVIGIAAVIGFPALQNTINRVKMDGIARQTAVLMRSARLEAIKNGGQARIAADFGNDRVVFYRNVGTTADFDADDEVVSFLKLPPGVTFWGPADGAPEGGDATLALTADGGGVMTGAYLEFESDGSTTGAVPQAIRFGDIRGNYLEAVIDPPTTGRSDVRKWDGSAWKAQAEGGASWTWN